MIFAIAFFISHMKNKDALIDLSVLKDRTYFFGTLIQVVLMSVFLASAVLLPSMLQRLLGYTSFLSGVSMASRGIGSIMGIFAYLILSRFIGNKRIAMIGLIFLGLGSVYFGMINLNINLSSIAVPNIFYGVGILLALTPLIPLSCSTIPNEEMTNASGLQNLLKNIGGVIGTSISTTMVSRYSQVHQMMMSGQLNYTNDAFNQNVNAMTAVYSKSVDALTAQGMAHGSIYSQLIEQAHLWAYVDTFMWFAFATFLLIPMLLFLNKSPKKTNLKPQQAACVQPFFCAQEFSCIYF